MCAQNKHDIKNKSGCQFYQQGQCKFGDKCWHGHPTGSIGCGRCDVNAKALKDDIEKVKVEVKEHVEKTMARTQHLEQELQIARRRP